MFLFNSGPALADSFLDIMGRSDNYGTSSRPKIYLFSGTMPNSIADLPYDVNYCPAVSEAAEACIVALANTLPNSNQKQIIEADHFMTIMPIKRSVWDERRQAYRLAPKYQGRYDLSRKILDEFPDWHQTNGYQRGDPNHEYYAEGSGLVSHQWQSYYGDYTWHNDRRENNSNANFYGLRYGGRYSFAGNNGVYMEFEQDVEVTAVDFWQWGGTTRTSYNVVFEYFDEVAGEWVAINSGDDPAVNSTGFNQDKEFVWTLPIPVTAKKFIFSGENTGSDAWYIREVSLLGTAEPYNTGTVDITWAMITPHWWDIYSNRFLESNTSSFTELGRHPVMICDVGGPTDSDKLVTLNQATGLPGFFNPKLLNFNLDFEEPGV